MRYEDIDSRGNVANVTPANSNSLSTTSAGLGVNYAVNRNWTVLAGVHEGFAPPGASVGWK